MPKYTSSILTPAPARSPRQCTSRRSRLSNTTFIAIPNPPTDSTPGVNSMRALWIQQFCHPYDNAPPTPASPSRPPPFAGNSTTRTSKMQPTVALGLNILIDQPRTTYDLCDWVADGPFAMVACGAIPTLHLVARWLRSAAASIKSKLKPNTSSKSAPRPPPDRAATELGDMTFMAASTKTTIERGALARSESAGNLEDDALPENGVRVDMVYNVRRDTRTNSECSRRRLGLKRR
ncbi:uncharacterized protein G6M90_00g040720 [Metarhizium brunneum]|uniref:Uncharacterized protein n=1 Tax=Metarhizium brunneum TaxID=500148 RepID=A0A7D5YZG9_9HYPO|nr:hypothetical protein G6M90_00g040720 [Metarhizium brunneum]